MTTINKPDAMGRLLYGNGDFYSGQWKDGQQNGRGRMIYEDGSVYDGQWRNNKFDGYGTYKHIDGSIIKGQWKEGILQKDQAEKRLDNSSDSSLPVMEARQDTTDGLISTPKQTAIKVIG